MEQCTLSNPRLSRSSVLRLLSALLGVGLLGYLVFRVGPGSLLRHTAAVGWGMGVILLLGGASHLVKSSAWRLTFPLEIRRSIPTSRAFALRLISEALGQLGVPGQVVGEGMRVSLLGRSVPLANRIASATIDRGLYTLSSVVVGVFGLLGAAMLFPLSPAWKLYSVVFAAGMLSFLALAVVAVQRRWLLLSAVFRGLNRIPKLNKWLEGKEVTVSSAEHTLLNFHRERPRDFWLSFGFNLVGQLLAISEIYLLLWFMNSRIGFVSALIFEGFTKLVNTVGGIVPGNVGTYEGGNMLIAKLFRVSPGVGFAVGICRHARALFWAAVGGICMFAISRTRKDKSNASTGEPGWNSSSVLSGDNHMQDHSENSDALIIISTAPEGHRSFIPALSHIGTLPAVLRIALSAQTIGVTRTTVRVDSAYSARFEHEVQKTGRCPESLDWYQSVGLDLAALARHVGGRGNVVFALADRSYRPTLLRKAIEWKRDSGALAFRCDSEFVGLYVLSPSLARELANYSGLISSLEDLHSWVAARTEVKVEQVDKGSWQRIEWLADRITAEKKLDTWLVKPTDGLFARMNRHVSIPISRWLLNFPVTPNMVTLFTLWVSFGAGLFFAYGGYWATVFGAVLSVWASILDGCDGEVARLKLQVTDFGCWLETICDYLYYVFVFGGMIMGLTRTMGMRFTMTWGPMLLIGAVASFFAVGYARHHFSAERPEAFLATWQKKAENRKSNPFLFVGRHCEFIIRRCFLPYAFLGFALLNIIPVAFVATAIGANVVWAIALYSCFTLSRRKVTASHSSALTATSTPAMT